MRFALSGWWGGLALALWSGEAIAQQPVPGSQLASLQVATFEEEPPSAGGVEIPKSHFLLRSEVGSRAVSSIIILRGSAFVQGVARPYFIWATRSDQAVQRRSVCVEQWNAVQMFVGGDPTSGAGAPWIANEAQLSVCFVAGEPRFEVRAEPENDPFRWGEIKWGARARYETPDADGTVSATLLPPALRPLKLPYDSGGTPPPGYVYKQKRLWGIAVGGAALFTLAYTIPLISAAASNSGNEGKWAVPFAGPIWVWGDFLGDIKGPCGDFCALRVMGVGMVTFTLWVDAIVQVLGVGGIVAGSLVKKRWWERADASPQVSWSLRPLPVAAGSGLQWSVRY